MTVILLILQSFFLPQLIEGAWIDRKAEGWAWYEDKKISKEAPEHIKNEDETAQKKLSDIKNQLEERLAEAVLNPSEQNIREYMVEQKKWLDRSSFFANIWGRVLLLNPELDPTATHYPVTQYGIQLQNQIDYENKKSTIAALSKEYGLFFFYEGESKISQGLAQVIKSFSESYNWLAIAISVDGTLIESFQNSKIDNGIAKKLHITTFPAVFIINPRTQVAIPIAFGLVSLDQIEHNIITQLKLLQEGVTHE